MIFFAVVVSCFPNIARSEDKAGSTIVAGSGWGKICIGTDRSEVEEILGKGEFLPKFDGVYLLIYKPKGIRVSLSNIDQTVHVIYFYNKQKGFEDFAVFNGKTSTGIDWNSTVDQVIKAYGKPIEDYSGNNTSGNWRRLAFKGIDFVYEDGRLVRICVPGTHQKESEPRKKIKKVRF